MALKRGSLADLVGDCIKSPLRASGSYFRINMILTEINSAETDWVRCVDETSLVVSVPKRWVKRAIDRNTIKRLGRVWWEFFVQSWILAHDNERESGLILINTPIKWPRMAFVQITPKMLDACRRKKAGHWGHEAWKQELAAELRALGVKIRSRYDSNPTIQWTDRTTP